MLPEQELRTKTNKDLRQTLCSVAFIQNLRSLAQLSIYAIF